MSENDHDLFTERMLDPGARLGFEREWLSQEFVVQLEEHMDARGIKRSELARMIGKSAPYVTQALRRGSNLTIKTMVELAMAVNVRVGLALIPMEEMELPRPVRWLPQSPAGCQTTEARRGIGAMACLRRPA